MLTIGDNLKRVIDHVPAEAAGQDPALKSFLDGVAIEPRCARCGVNHPVREFVPDATWTNRDADGNGAS